MRKFLLICVILLLSMAGCGAVVAVLADQAEKSLTLESPYAVETEPEEVSSETVGQENARKSAESYLDGAAFSRKGLVKQLEYEGFSHEDAVYGVDSVRADWKQEAAESAQSYLDSSSFSRSGLRKQLEYEGFTPAQAKYGVTQTGL